MIFPLYDLRMQKQVGSSAIYGLGIIGALVYFIQHAHTLLDGLIGIVLAIFWPAVVVYKVLEILKV